MDFDDIINIRSLYIIQTEHDLGKFINSFSRSYTSSPLMTYLFETKPTCHNCIDFHIFWEIYIRTLYEQGALLLASSPNMEVVSIWFPPEFKKISLHTFLNFGGYRIMDKLPKLLWYRFYSTFSRHRFTSKSWVLNALVVKDNFQYKGYASKVINPMLDYIEKQNLNCFVETHRIKNITFFEHYGFKLVKTKKFGKYPYNFTHYVMLKKANS